MARFMRWVGGLVVGHPGWVTALSLVVTLFWYANIHNLRTGTDLTDLFGNRDPQWRAASQIGKELGYGNQLFVLIDAPATGTDATGQMEEMADRLTADMQGSGLFLNARCGLQDQELLDVVRFFTWNFPSFALPEQAEDLKRRLDPQQIHQTVRRAATELVTPFSSLGTNYFVADPLGLMEVARKRQGFSQFANFDLNWGSGNRFFSKDHKALLIIAEPRQSAMDYKFAEQVMRWTREHIQSMTAEPDLRDSGVRAIAAGAYVYAEQEHQLVETNIRRISTDFDRGESAVVPADLSEDSTPALVAVACQPGHFVDHGRSKFLSRRSKSDQPVFYCDSGGTGRRPGRTFLQPSAAGMGQGRDAG